MRKALVPAILILVALSRPAAAQGSDGTGFGFGVQAMLTDFGVATTGQFLAGPSLAYQARRAHVELIGHYESNGQTVFGLAGRAFYELHSTRSADFSVGGGVGFVNLEIEGIDASTTDIHIELGGQVRAFVAPNFALGASVGLGVIALEDLPDLVGLTGQLVGSAGATYFFF